MANYLLFDATRKGFDDGDGNMVSLGKHLDYVNDYNGTPENFDTLEDLSFNQMKFETGRMSQHIFVVEEERMRVVFIANDPKLEKAHQVEDECSM